MTENRFKHLSHEDIFTADLPPGLIKSWGDVEFRYNKHSIQVRVGPAGTGGKRLCFPQTGDLPQQPSAGTAQGAVAFYPWDMGGKVHSQASALALRCVPCLSSLSLSLPLPKGERASRSRP